MTPDSLGRAGHTQFEAPAARLSEAPALRLPGLSSLGGLRPLRPQP